MEVDHMETVIERTEPLEDSQVAEQVTVEPEYGSKNSSVLESVHTDPSTQDREGSTFSAKIAAYQQELESEFKMYEDSLSTRQVDVELEDLDWDELESRYQAEMKLQVSNEQEIMDDFSVRFQQFLLWMQVSNEKEAERSIKRLKTRATFVQNSEAQLADKQGHYAKVLDAFQSAMALLGNL